MKLKDEEMPTTYLSLIAYYFRPLLASKVGVSLCRGCLLVSRRRKRKVVLSHESPLSCNASLGALNDGPSVWTFVFLRPSVDHVIFVCFYTTTLWPPFCPGSQSWKGLFVSRVSLHLAITVDSGIRRLTCESAPSIASRAEGSHERVQKIQSPLEPCCEWPLSVIRRLEMGCGTVGHCWRTSPMSAHSTFETGPGPEKTEVGWKLRRDRDFATPVARDEKQEYSS